MENSRTQEDVQGGLGRATDFPGLFCLKGASQTIETLRHTPAVGVW